ncbi:MAG: benzoate-CoA ligase family protein [Sneathiella sp.]|nr:benzoate-CoA ligase family protein [Sneathiella sp.]
MENDQGNAAIYFVDRQETGGNAQKIAFIEGTKEQRSLTYEALGAQSGKLAHLYERHGLGAEDRAAMITLDCIEFPVIFWGSLKAGIIPIPINTLLSTDLYAAILSDARAKALFVSAELLPVVEPALKHAPHIKVVFVIGEAPEKYVSFSDALLECERRPTRAASADECAFWLYSSGSTGKPKGVRHVHSALQATSETYGAKVLGIETSDVVYSVAKLFFAYGLGNGMTFPMSVGATTVLYPQRPTPDAVFDIMKKFKPSIFCGVPTLYAALLAAMKGSRPDGFDTLRRCISAGEALPSEIGRKWSELINVEILDGVGSTEMLHIFLSNIPNDVAYGTSGVAVPGYELRLVDDQGGSVKTGDIGELLVKGDSTASDYWNQREKSKTTFEGHWTRTGDKYERREDGRYVYCGRTDDMFKVSGIWVSPFEVEQALIEHPAVLEAAVVPAMDSDKLEKPKAYVVLQAGIVGTDVEQDLINHVKQAVGKWKYPRWIIFVDDLPKTATGKIQRFKLRDGWTRV